MASKYAIGAGGNFTADTTWSTTDGGANDTTKPTAADDVFLTSNSGAVTIDSGSVCRSLNCTGYTNVLTHNTNITIGDGTAGASNIALKLVSGMTYTAGYSFSIAVFTFASTSATVQTVDTANKVTGGITYSGAGGSWQLTSEQTTGTTSTVTLTLGTLDTNGQTCSWGLFSSTGAGSRTLTLGASAITLTGTGTPFNIVSSITLTANTATLTFSGAGITTQTANKDFGGTLVYSGSGTASWSGTGTIANVTRTGTTAKTDAFSLSQNLTISGTFTVNSNSDVNRLFIRSDTVGTARTITAATVVIANTADFQDITGAGAATWTVAGTGATAIGDCGGLSGITPTTAATQTYTGGTGNWSDVTKWTSRVPLPQDDVLMSGVTGGTITADMPRLGKSIDWTGASGTPTWTNSVAVSIYGSLTLISAMNNLGGSGGFSFSGRGTFTITSAGKGFGSNSTTINGFGGTYTLGDAFAATFGNFTCGGGTFNTAGMSMNVSSFLWNNTATKTINLSTSQISVNSTSTATVVAGSTTGTTLSAADSTFIVSTASANTRTIGPGGSTLGTLTYTVAGSTGTLVITSSNSFAGINFLDATNARTLQFTAGTTTTIRNTNGFNVVGTTGKLMTVTSVTAAQHTLSSSANQSTDYLDISYSLVTGGGWWRAGNNSRRGLASGTWLLNSLPGLNEDNPPSRSTAVGRVAVP